MSAFNNRFKPPEIFGIDVRAFLLLTLASLMVVLFVLMPHLILRLGALFLAVFMGFLGIYILLVREKLPWLATLLDGRFDLALVSVYQQEDS